MNRRFQQLCERARDDADLPALAVGTLVDGKVSTLMLGCDAGTRFRIASVTKPMTAALVLALLDPDEVAGIWPEDVRVRHLLAHTSGFACELADRAYARFGTGDDALARCVAELPDVPRFFGIDEVWSYANTGYWLAGSLAAARAGTTFEEALAARVLGPAGLVATSFDEPDLEGHGTGIPPTPYPRARRPSGGLSSTVEDVLRFGAWQLAQRESAAQRIVAGKPVDGVYGFGLFGERVGGTEVWGHPGSYGGFESTFLTVPAHNAVLVALTNAQRGRKALELIEGGWLEDVTGVRRAERPSVEVSAGELGPLAGRYSTLDGVVEVEIVAGVLRVRLADGTETPARAIGPRTFELTQGEDAGARFDFPRPGFIRLGSRVAELVP